MKEFSSEIQLFYVSISILSLTFVAQNVDDVRRFLGKFHKDPSN